jgi:hypothetical protein
MSKIFYFKSFYSKNIAEDTVIYQQNSYLISSRSRRLANLSQYCVSLKLEPRPLKSQPNNFSLELQIGFIFPFYSTMALYIVHKRKKVENKRRNRDTKLISQEGKGEIKFLSTTE